jgi:hypothetical protein
MNCWYQDSIIWYFCCGFNFLTVHVYILSLFPVAPTLEHRASVKHFVSLQFLSSKTVGRTPWTGDQAVARPLPTQTQNKRRHLCLEWDSNPRPQCSDDRRQSRIQYMIEIKIQRIQLCVMSSYVSKQRMQALNRHHVYYQIPKTNISTIPFYGYWKHFYCNFISSTYPD